MYCVEAGEKIVQKAFILHIVMNKVFTCYRIVPKENNGRNAYHCNCSLKTAQTEQRTYLFSSQVCSGTVCDKQI